MLPEWPAVYGALGRPSSQNSPGGIDSEAAWTDQEGRFWLFGGIGVQGTAGCPGLNPYGYLNTLWEFDPATSAWTWKGGSSNILAQPPVGVYGTRGKPAEANFPGARANATSWTDNREGNLWLFGGFFGSKYGETTDNSTYNDLWEFNPSTNEWTWRGGNSKLTYTDKDGQKYRPGLYGTRYVPSEENSPGSRQESAGWAGADGTLVLYGGYGYDSDGNLGVLDDLWEFGPASGKWTWIGGSDRVPANPAPKYGQLGEFSPASWPGARTGEAAWVDKEGDFWLFGGFVGAANTGYSANDLWEFDPAIRKWAWMGGSKLENQPGMYGKAGVAAKGNVPGARSSATVWKGAEGVVWLLGGSGYDAAGNDGVLNDLWKLDPATHEWTWVNGADILPQITDSFGDTKYAVPLGVNGTIGSLSGAAGWEDRGGNFWLYAGSGWAFDYDNEGAGNVPYLSGDFNNMWVSQRIPESVPAPAPYFNIGSGTYRTPQSVLIGDPAGADIYYTTDGTAPTTKSKKLGGPIPQVTVSATATLKAIAVVSGFAPSAVTEATYTFPYKAQTVEFTQPSPLPGYLNWTGKPIEIKVEAKASSGLAVVLKVEQGPAYWSGKTLIVTQPYVWVFVTASQAGNAAFAPASTYWEFQARPGGGN